MKNKALLYTLLFLCISSCARLPQKSSEGFVVEVPEWYNNDTLRAEYLYSEGVKVAALADDRREALPYFEKVLEIDSLHAPTHYQMGDIVMSHDPGAALRHGRIASRADSTNVDYLGLYGYSLVSNNELQLARTVYEKLVRLEPHNGYNYQMLASLYKANNMPYMALSVLDSAEYKLGRANEIVGQRLGILYSLNLYDRAIEEIKTEIANNPRNVAHLTMLGYLYAKTQQDSLVVSTFERALALSPQNTDALLGLATFHKQRGREEEFLQVLKTLFLVDGFPSQEAIAIWKSDVIDKEDFYIRNFFTINSLITALYLKHPQVVEVERCYAEHLLRAGETEKGIDQYKQIVRKSLFEPNQDLFMVVGGERYLNRRDSAMYYLDLSIKLHPNRTEPLLQKAYIILGEEGETATKEARKLFERALKVTQSPVEKSEIYCSLANMESDPNKQARLYKRALDENPDNAMALNNWAYSLINSPKEFARALEMSTRACELEPTNATYLDTKAWLYFLMGNTVEAKRVMRQAISLDRGGDGTLLLHFGDILAAEGDSFMAEIYYKRALDAGEDAALIEAKIEGLKKR